MVQAVRQLVVGSWTADVDARVHRLLTRLRNALGVDAVFVCDVRDGVQVFRDVVTTRPLPFERGSVQDVLGTYCELVLADRLGTLTTDTRHDPRTAHLPATAEADIGCYLGVPVRLADGREVGTLCGFTSAAGRERGDSDVAVLRACAEAVAELVQHEYDAAVGAGAVADQVQQVLVDLGPVVVYQPVVGLHGQPVLFHEALSRFGSWGLGGPATWFAAARSVGSGPALERAAVRAAVRSRPLDGVISVNLSPQALCQTDTVDLLLSLPPGTVGYVEVVEDEVVDHPRLVSALGELRRGGIGVALDDAGAGSANLHHLASLELDVIKIDKDLVTPVLSSRRHRDLVGAVVGFGRSVGAQVVAEGVEDAAQADLLAALGVGYGQGWHVGPPAPGRQVGPLPDGLSGGTGPAGDGAPSGPSRP